jgi:hypothetical protein
MMTICSKFGTSGFGVELGVMVGVIVLVAVGGTSVIVGGMGVGTGVENEQAVRSKTRHNKGS